jgi:pilus assembly protein Flp/PilA
LWGTSEAICFALRPFFFSKRDGFPSQYAIAAAFEAAASLEQTMKSFSLKLKRFLTSEDGPTAVEYAVMLALIIVVCLTAITAIGTNANATFQSVAAKLPAGAAS